MKQSELGAAAVVIAGDSGATTLDNTYYILQENGDKILLEDNSGAITKE